MTKLTFEDFLTDTNLMDGADLPLMKDGKPTEHTLHVIGAQAKSVARDRIRWSIGVNALKDKYDGEEDKEKLLIDAQIERDEIDKAFAFNLVTGWSFPKFSKAKLKQLLDSNIGLAEMIIMFAFEQDGSRQKK